MKDCENTYYHVYCDYDRDRNIVKHFLDLGVVKYFLQLEVTKRIAIKAMIQDWSEIKFDGININKYVFKDQLSLMGFLKDNDFSFEEDNKHDPSYKLFRAEEFWKIINKDTEKV